MTIKFIPFGGGAMSLTEFSDKHALTLEVRERPANGCARYYAHFKDTELSRGSMLVSEHGNGSTVDEAIRDYCQLIQGQRLVVNAMRPMRREIDIPRELTYVPQ